jgi:hypothetical protein
MAMARRMAIHRSAQSMEDDELYFLPPEAQGRSKVDAFSCSLQLLVGVM